MIQAPENAIRIGIIGAAFLTVTLALVLMQPSADDAAEAPVELAENEAVARAQTDILDLVAEPALQTPEPSVGPAVDAITASVLASLGGTAPKADAAEIAAVQAPQNADALRDLTSSVLSGLTGAPASGSPPAQSMEALVTQALRQGQSDAYIEALLNEADSNGAINVPTALRTNEGRVDTATLLAELVRKSDPASAAVPQAIASGDGVEVRVVQHAGETRQYNFYTVQSGDSLGAIAHRFYGDAALYTAIFEANRQFISRPDRIRVGQRLSIPNTPTSG